MTVTIANASPDQAITTIGSTTAQSRRVLVSQVNARIETLTKQQADEAFAVAGITPSEAIRALYARAATLGTSLKTVGDLVVGASGDEADAHNQRLAAFHRTTHAFEDMLVRHNLSVEVEGFAPMTEEEIEEAMFHDYLAGDAL